MQINVDGGMSQLEPLVTQKGQLAMTRYHTININGPNVFYREAGRPGAPAVLLLHGFPTSSHMFRELIPQLARQYHVFAPDLPGFGFSDAPPRGQFQYSFENLARIIGLFTEAVGLDRFAIYVFDYGAPVGLRRPIHVRVRSVEPNAAAARRW